MLKRFINHWRKNIEALQWLHDRQMHGEPVAILQTEVDFTPEGGE